MKKIVDGLFYALLIYAGVGIICDAIKVLIKLF